PPSASAPGAVAARATHPHCGTHRSWLSRICSWSFGSDTHSGAERGSSGEHGADPAGQRPRTRLEIFRRRIHHNATTGDRYREGAVSTISSRYRAGSYWNEQQYLSTA